MLRKGFITFITMLFVILILITLVILAPAKAASTPSKTLTWPYNGETSMTMVLYDYDNGNVIKSDDGTSLSTTTWDNGEITGTRHSISGKWVFTIYEPTPKRVAGSIYDSAAASVSKDSSPIAGGDFMYDWKSNAVFSDVTPVRDGKVMTAW